MTRQHCVLCSDGSCPTCNPPPPDIDTLAKRFSEATGTDEERAREILKPRDRHTSE